jgi:hypothetical protein
MMQVRITWKVIGIGLLVVIGVVLFVIAANIAKLPTLLRR